MNNRNYNPNRNNNENWRDTRQKSSSGKVIAGLILIIIGIVMLGNMLHYFYLPKWMFSWEVLLIALGLFLGFKNNFRKSGWLVMVTIGGFFLANDLIRGVNLQYYIGPIVLIIIGLWVILKPKKESPRHIYDYQDDVNRDLNNDSAESGNSKSYNSDANYASEEILDSVAIFGGVKKNIISKNFKGGEVVSVFGGTELNLSQADIQHPVMLEATQIFGGTTLIIPPHWEVKSEMVAILGGIDDKRPIVAGGYDSSKVLIIKGTTLFGGLQLKSY